MPDETVMMKANTRTQRNSSFELLRIVSMVMIVFHHFAVHGGFEWDASSVSIPYLWCNFISMGGKIGVNVFVLISGYFLVKREGPVFDFKRILKFEGQLLFYSIAACLFGLMVPGKLGIQAFIEAIFPITSSCWWFASTYFVLFLLHPFLNKLLACLDRKSYQALLVLLVTCWSVIPTLTTAPYQGSDLSWFITLYAISGYARLYGFNPKLTSGHYFLLCGIFSVLTYVSSAVSALLGRKWRILFSVATYCYGQEKLPMLLISLTLFMGFAAWKMAYHKWINVAASATFGVYLIHDHPLVRPFLWRHVLQNARYQDSLMLIPYSVMAAAIVYAVCTAIDLLRQRLIEQAYMRVVNTYADSWLKPFERVCGFLKQIVFGK